MTEYNELNVPKGITGPFEAVGTQVDRQMSEHQKAYTAIKNGNGLFKDSLIQKCDQLITTDYFKQQILIQLRTHFRDQISQNFASAGQPPTPEQNQQINQTLSKTQPIQIVETLDTWINGWKKIEAQNPNNALAIDAAKQLSHTFLEASLLNQ